MLVNYIYYYKAVVGNQLFIYIAVIIPCSYLAVGCSWVRELFRVRNLVFFLAIVSYIISSYLSSSTGFGFSIYFTLGIILLLSFSLSDEYHPYILRFAGLFSAGYVIITLLSALFTSSYMGSLSLFYKEPQLSSVFYLTEAGDYAGIAGHSGQNAFFISVLTGILFVRLFFGEGQKKTYFVFYLIAVLALFYTGRRGPILGNIVASFLVVFFYFRKSNSLWKLLPISVIFAGIFYLMQLYIPKVSNLFTKNELLANDGDITNGRIELYEYAYYLFWQKPFFGQGPLTYVALRKEYTGDIESSLNAHSSYLQMLAETGIVGATLFVLCLLIILIPTLYLLIFRREQGEGSKQEIFLLSSLYVQIVFVVLCFSESIAIEFQILYTYFLFSSIALYYSRQVIKTTL